MKKIEFVVYLVLSIPLVLGFIMENNSITNGMGWFLAIMWYWMYNIEKDKK